MKHLSTALCLLVLMATPVLAAGPINYPDGYRAWHHVKSMVILPGHALENPFAGIHHVYANDKAAKGLESGKYRNGAVFVFDLLEANTGGHAVQEGQRKLIGVMVRHNQRYASTGGWGFEGFSARDKRLVTDGGQGCYSCHTQVSDRSYVFTQSRD